MSKVSQILEGLAQDRIEERRASGLSDLVLLRAMYVKDLYNAIKKGNQKALDKWVNDYKADPLNKEELSWYEDEKLDVKKLRKELAEQEAEYDRVHAQGRTVFGESSIDEAKLQPMPKNSKPVTKNTLKALWKCISDIGGKEWDEIDFDTKCYTYPKGTDPIDVAVNALNIVRKNGYKARFIGNDGIPLDDNKKPSKHGYYEIEVLDSVKERGFNILIYTDPDNDDDNCEFCDIEISWWSA